MAYGCLRGIGGLQAFVATAKLVKQHKIIHVMNAVLLFASLHSSATVCI